MKKIAISVTSALVGAGIVGLGTAYLIRRSKHKAIHGYYQERLQVPLGESTSEQSAPLWLPMEDGALWVVGDQEGLDKAREFVNLSLINQPESALKSMSFATLESFESALLAMSHREENDLIREGKPVFREYEKLITPIFIDYQEWMVRAEDFHELVKRSGERGILVIVLTTPESIVNTAHKLRSLMRVVFLPNPVDIDTAKLLFTNFYQAAGMTPRGGLYPVLSHR